MWIKFRKGKAINLNHYGSLEVVEHPHHFYTSNVTEKHFTLTAIREQKRTDYRHIISSENEEHCHQLLAIVLNSLKAGKGTLDVTGI